MLEFRFRYSISFSPDDLSAMRILVLCVILWSLYCLERAGLGLGLGTTGLGLGFGLEGVGFGLGHATAGVDYNIVWY